MKDERVSDAPSGMRGSDSNIGNSDENLGDDATPYCHSPVSNESYRTEVTRHLVAVRYTQNTIGNRFRVVISHVGYQTALNYSFLVNTRRQLNLRNPFIAISPYHIRHRYQFMYV